MNIHSLFTACVIGFVLSADMHAQSIAWFHPYAGTNAECTGVQRSASGDLFMSGTTRNNNPFDGLAPGNLGYDDGFVALADAMGTMQWIYSIGAYSSDIAWDVIEFGGRVTVRGNVINWGGSSNINYNGTSTPIEAGGAYVMQVDTAGALQALYQPNGPTTDMVVDGTGNIYFAAAEDSMRYYKMAPNGTILEQRTFSDHLWGAAIAASPSGDVWIAGHWAGPYPSTIWVGGQPFNMSSNAHDIVVAKFDANGNTLFTTQFGGAGSEKVNDMIIADDGTMRLSGTFGGVVNQDGATLPGNGPRWFLATFAPSGALLALDDTTFMVQGGASGKLGMNDAGEVIASINFSDTLIHGLDTMVTGYPTSGILAKWDAFGQLSWYTALGYNSAGRINTGVNFGSVVGDSIFVGGRTASAAYTALVIDTTYVPLTTSIAPSRAIPEQNWTVYPNPASTELTLSGVEAGCQLQLIDPAGRVLWNRVTRTSSDFIDVSTVPPGVYTLRLISGTGSSSRRVLVLK